MPHPGAPESARKNWSGVLTKLSNFLEVFAPTIIRGWAFILD
jgi:hypothetical protein